MGRFRRPWRTAAALLLTMATALPALAACGSEAAGGVTTITFWDDNGGPARTPVWQHIIAEFEKANPTIKVEYVGIPIAQAQQKYDTAVAGGGLPDVGGVTTAMLANLVPQRALEPVDDLFGASPLAGQLNERIVGSVRQTVPDGKLYLLPISTNTGVFWARKDWLAEAGLPEPETWDQLFAAIERFTAPGQNRYGFTIRGGAGSIAQMLEVVYGQSGITKMFEPDGRSTVDDPRNVAALERLAGLYKRFTPEADLTNDYAKMVAQFGGGNIGVMQHNVGSYQDQVKALGADKVVALPVPKSAAGTRAVLSHPTTGLGVFSQGEHTEAAFRFAEFAASPAMNTYWAEQTGTLPVNSGVTASDPAKPQPGVALAKVLAEPSTTVVQMPYHLPEFNSITKTESEPGFQKVLLGELSAKDFLTELAGKLGRAQAEYQQRTG
ncbi:sugar ABC transporter substrate-binding protein [Amycolatopsis sp. 195334CR]|uniref:ABC transporter substrate-binding protein n=1 Tax=Amycolatopsis sp. 195334CR TaxID=2814588 RepID=UPI001A90856E|nr:sugar ABC transporter substrate-binding protein [Amycolatopsis sp. 195334CR]MBN6038067.1 sugar ABC transporter substrate-binding protein [Amycolatopsis sp. 195334CR]